MAKGRKPKTEGTAKSSAILKAITVANYITIYILAKNGKWTREKIAEKAAAHFNWEMAGVDMKHFSTNLWNRMFGGSEQAPGVLTKLGNQFKNLGLVKKRLNKIERLIQAKFENLPVEYKEKLNKEASKQDRTGSSLFANKQKAAKEEFEEVSAQIEQIEHDAAKVGYNQKGELLWIPEGGSSGASRPYHISSLDAFGDLLSAFNDEDLEDDEEFEDEDEAETEAEDEDDTE